MSDLNKVQARGSVQIETKLLNPKDQRTKGLSCRTRFRLQVKIIKREEPQLKFKQKTELSGQTKLLNNFQTKGKLRAKLLSPRDLRVV